MNIYSLKLFQKIYITNRGKEICEVLFTNKESKKALKRMQTDRNPGWDGLTTDFYKIICPVIGETLVEMIKIGDTLVEKN